MLGVSFVVNGQRRTVDGESDMHGARVTFLTAGGPAKIRYLIHQFSELGGTIPAGQLVESNGVLYGATVFGGGSGSGAVYELQP